MKKGFAGMDPEKHREICRKGGKSVQAQGKAHRWTPETAREAGRIGARVTHERERARRAAS